MWNHQDESGNKLKPCRSERAENIRSVWSDEETVFLTVFHRLTGALLMTVISLCPLLLRLFNGTKGELTPPAVYLLKPINLLYIHATEVDGKCIYLHFLSMEKKEGR